MNQMHWPLILSALFQTVIVGYVFWAAPGWSRQGLFFAVTVAPEARQTDALRQILQRYRKKVMIVSLVTVVALTITAVLGDVVWLMILPLLQLAAGLASFLLARHRAQRFASPPDLTREARLNAEAEKPSVNWLAQLGPFLILALATGLLTLLWQQIPDTYVSHWNSEFEPDGWTEKSVASLGSPLLIVAVLCLMLQAMAWSIQTSARRVDASGKGAEQETKRRRVTGRIVLAASYFMAILMATISLSPIAQTKPQADLFLLVTLGLGTLGSLGLVIYGLKTMTPHFRSSSRSVESPGDRSSDDRWKLGAFYYAPDDPALWVEKRFGLGYTLNMARPAAWGIMVAFILGPLALIVGAMIWS